MGIFLALIIGLLVAGNSTDNNWQVSILKWLLLRAVNDVLLISNIPSNIGLFVILLQEIEGNLTQK